MSFLIDYKNIGRRKILVYVSVMACVLSILCIFIENIIAIGLLTVGMSVLFDLS